jgi:hypothetical protein
VWHGGTTKIGAHAFRRLADNHHLRPSFSAEKTWIFKTQILTFPRIGCLLPERKVKEKAGSGAANLIKGAIFIR